MVRKCREDGERDAGKRPKIGCRRSDFLHENRTVGEADVVCSRAAHLPLFGEMDEKFDFSTIEGLLVVLMAALEDHAVFLFTHA